MKRKHTVTLVAAALIAALLCGTALAAATGFSLRDMFSQMDADGVTRVNEAAISHIRAVDCRYESEDVLYTVDECLYNSREETLALSATFTSKVPGNRYYILLERLTAGGKPIDGGREYNLTEVFLNDTPVRSACAAFVPDAAGTEVSIRYAVLKLTGTLVSDKEAQELRALERGGDWETFNARIAELAAEELVYVESDGTIACADNSPAATYTDTLLATGCFELTDRFTVIFRAEDSADASETLVYTGPESFEFDGAKFEILSAEVGENRATLALRATLTNETYRAWFGEEGWQAGWSIHAGGELAPVSAQGVSDGFTQNADGSWTITEEYIFGMLYSQPTEIPLILETVNPDGTVTTHSDMPITLTFARK